MKLVLGLVVAAFLSQTLVAGEKFTKPLIRKPGPKDVTPRKLASVTPNAKPAETHPWEYAFNLPTTVQLTPKQTKQIEAMKKKLGPKYWDSVQKAQNVLTPEQIKKQKDAYQKAFAEGKRGPELATAVNAATAVTPDQEKKRQEQMQESAKIYADIRRQVFALLTEDQKKVMEATFRRDAALRAQAQGKLPTLPSQKNAPPANPPKK